MERASRILGKLQIKPVAIAGIKTYHLAPTAWAAAVGKKIAAHAKPVFLQNKTLTIDVEDAVWQAQLRTLESAILPRIEQIAGAGFVERLEFRLVPPRRGAAIASSSHATVDVNMTDESAAISDPIMRRVYRSARRKANA